MRSYTILFLHGFGGKRKHHWFNWLERELTELGFRLLYPKLPDAFNPKSRRWIDSIAELCENERPQAVVAHSLGALAWWHYMYQYSYPIKAALYIAPPTHAAFSKIENFFPLPPTLPQHTNLLLYDTADANIQEQALTDIAARFHLQTRPLEGCGHFDAADEIKTLPEALFFLIRHFQSPCS